MKTYRTAIITGAIALIAVIATVIIISLGNAGSGLYIAASSGDVTITAPDGSAEAASVDRLLAEGDIVTVNSGSCRRVYRSRDNSEDENYIVLEPLTQLFVSDEFSGKDDGELYLNRGAVFVSSMLDSSANVIIRTESSSYTTKRSAMRIAYVIGEGNAVTYAAAFGGSSEINLFDTMGNLVDRNGYKLQSAAPEILGEGRTSILISGDTPSFESLNVPAVLSDYSADTLKELFTVSSFSELAFTSDEIKAAYDNAPTDISPATEMPVSSDTLPSETTAPIMETLPAETTVPESVTEETTTTTPYTTAATTQTTTAAPVTTTARPQTTTAAPVTTTARPVQTTTEAYEPELIPVYIIIEDEIIAQEVEYGGNASQPSVPEIPGKKFIGWDGDFNNITEDTTITAIFEDIQGSAETTVTTAPPDYENPFDNSSAAVTTAEVYYTVTIIINGQATTQQVAHGQSAKLPDVSVPGFTFLGWEGDGTIITSDTTITAILVPDPTYNTDTQTLPATTTSAAFSDVTL